MNTEPLTLTARPSLIATFVAALEGHSGAFVTTAEELHPGDRALLSVVVDHLHHPVRLAVEVVARRKSQSVTLPGGVFVRPLVAKDPALEALHSVARGGRPRAA